VFKDLLENYVNSDASEEGFNWTNAVQAVYNGDAAMFLHGDWAKGYFVQLGWTPGKDFGVVGAPGAADLFLYGVDVFAIPKGAQNDRGAREFLATIASTEGQIAFNKLKGSIPVRLDAPAGQLDVLGQAALHDFQNARIRMLVRGRQEWDDAIADFAKTKDVDALLRAYLDNPPG
jgi:glucose/mannose transport system substrate-binding protein